MTNKDPQMTQMSADKEKDKALPAQEFEQFSLVGTTAPTSANLRPSASSVDYSPPFET